MNTPSRRNGHRLLAMLAIAALFAAPAGAAALPPLQ